MKNKSRIAKITSRIKSIFFNGLVAILPITVTIFVVHFTFTHIMRWLEPIHDMEPEILQKIPGSEVLLVFVFIFFIGILLKLFIINPIIHYFERIIEKIPLIRSIYSSAKRLADFFNVPQHEEMQRQVVLMEYPRPNHYNIAFLLGSASKNFQTTLEKEGKSTGEEYVRVFMPNSPNPSSGYFFILPRSAVIPIDITFEEAIKTIVSCGLITPESLKPEDHVHDYTCLPPQ